MIRFECDYAEGAHPQVLEALVKTNMEQTTGYGTDRHCEHAQELIREACKDPLANVYFVTGGTPANVTVISSLLKPFQGCVCATNGHINVHEAGAVEATGHKVIPLEAKDGKLQAHILRKYLKDFWADPTCEHMVQPGMVYISSPTELGTVYTKKELEDISGVCREYAIPLYLDGARLGYGLKSEGNDVTLEDVDRLTDVFYIGGTKVGILMGEAIVFPGGKGLDANFRSMIKQNCAMLAKGRLLGVQFEALFTDGLYEKMGEHAVTQAMRIKKAFQKKGYRFPVDSPTNQQFLYLPRKAKEELSKEFAFESDGDLGQDEFFVRFCTSWATDPNHVDQLIDAIEKL